MESCLQNVGDWQGTTMVSASDTWAVFGFMGPERAGAEIWTEQVLAWVMADHRFTADKLGTVFYGLSLQSTRRGDIFRGPDICEAIHDRRGCHLGYSRISLADADTQPWQEAAAEHMKRCRRRRAAAAQQ